MRPRAALGAAARLLLAAGLMLAAVAAEAGGTRLAAIAFHDVVDRREDRAEDAVTTASLVAFFDWLKAEGWTPVSAAAVRAAGQGGPPLPDKAILLSFDDGYRSVYDRVYPLLLAYRYPAVVALVGSWMDTPAGGTVDYGGRPLPRAAFVSWDEVRRMQASGLVEIASHSHDLHRVVPLNAAGNTAPAARAWRFDPLTGRTEDDAAHRARIRADLARSRQRIAEETGRPPALLVWPFGRFSGPALEEAAALGFTMALTLEPEAADARQPLTLGRYYPTRDPGLGEIADNLRFAPPRAPTVRLACVAMAPLAAATDPAARDALLGTLIEDVRALGATAVVLEAARTGSDGRLASAWLPTPLLPLEADLFGRVARQLGTRAGVEVHARLPLAEALATLGEAGARAFAADIARAAPIDGLLIEGAASAVPAPASAPSPEAVRAARAADTSAAARLFAGAAAIDRRLRLTLVAPSAPPVGAPPHADAVLLPAAGHTPALATGGWLAGGNSGRVIQMLPPGPPAETRAALRRLQQQGGTAAALCPWSPADTGALAPDLSAATFPARP